MKISINTNSIQKKLSKYLAELEVKSTTGKDILDIIGVEIVKDIQYNARRGVDKNGVKFEKPLSKGWVKIRKRIENSKHPAFKFNRNNLTITGGLMSAMTVLPSTSRNTITIGFEGTNKGYKYTPLSEWKVKRKGQSRKVTFKRNPSLMSTMGIIKGGKSYAEIASDVNKTRPFFGIRPKMIERITKMYIDDIRRRLRNLKKTN